MMVLQNSECAEPRHGSIFPCTDDVDSVMVALHPRIRDQVQTIRCDRIYLVQEGPDGCSVEGQVEESREI